jgi:ribonuclease G
VFLFLKNRDKKEKDRLKKLVQSIKPKGFGVIVRTVAEGKNTAELEDMQNLLSRWDAMCKNYRPLIIRQNFRSSQ